MKCNVTFFPENRCVEVESESNLLKAALDVGILIDGTCAGKGICGKCKVIVEKENQDELSEKEKAGLSTEEIEKGYRLACQTKVCENMKVTLPKQHGNSERKKAMNRLPEGFQSSINVKKMFLTVPKATLDSQINDIDRIRMASENHDLSVNSTLLPRLQKSITEQRGKLTITLIDNFVIDAEAGDNENECWGIAFDIGTTTIVGNLCNLSTGELVDSIAKTNPQSIFGSDVISRIEYCMENEENTAQMQEKVIQCFNSMIQDFSSEHGIQRGNIYKVTVVGNTTMSHIFWGVNPISMARVPFAPVFREGEKTTAEQLGLDVNPLAQVYLLPNIAGHVGSDITGVMIASDLARLKGNTIAIDIGTNGEILMAKDGQMKTCSTAAGPAFEGACIKYGMRAAQGAIEAVTVDDDVHLKIIDDDSPVGICGSGLIDAVAQLLNAGIITAMGNLIDRKEAERKNLPEKLCSRLEGEGSRASFRISGDGKEKIYLTQQDIREVQLAKGAILGGMLTLMRKFNLTPENLDRIILAGAFGNYINKNSAIKMGLLPHISEKKVISIGNGAGIGAAMVLLSDSLEEKAERQTREIEHVELSKDMDFQELYIESMLFEK